MFHRSTISASLPCFSLLRRRRSISPHSFFLCVKKNPSLSSELPFAIKSVRMFQLWEIRAMNKDFDPDATYEGYPKMFTIELHHGGKFMQSPGIRYIEGKVNYVDLVDMDQFSVQELEKMMLKLGYEVPPEIYYHFQLPNHEDFEFGIRGLRNDDDVLNLSKYIEQNKVIKVYTEHTIIVEEIQVVEPVDLSLVLSGTPDLEDFNPFFGEGEYVRDHEGEHVTDHEVGNGGEVAGGTDGSEYDSDYLEDEENYVTDVEVDMADFFMSVEM